MADLVMKKGIDIAILQRYHTIVGRLPDNLLHSPDKTDHKHLLWMLEQIMIGEVTGKKSHRWLGFIQGVLAARMFISVDEERNVTRPFFRGEEDVT